MGERTSWGQVRAHIMAMTKRPIAVAILLAAAVAIGLAWTDAASAQTRGRDTGASNAGLDAQTQVRPRARTRIRVYRTYPRRLFSIDYPPPYDIEWPGPNAVRQCTSWLAREYRPSGPVIVPHKQCWWQRG